MFLEFNIKDVKNIKPRIVYMTAIEARMIPTTHSTFASPPSGLILHSTVQFVDVVTVSVVSWGISLLAFSAEYRSCTNVAAPAINVNIIPIKNMQCLALGLTSCNWVKKPQIPATITIIQTETPSISRKLFLCIWSDSSRSNVFQSKCKFLMQI